MLAQAALETELEQARTLYGGPALEHFAGHEEHGQQGEDARRQPGIRVDV